MVRPALGDVEAEDDEHCLLRTASDSYASTAFGIDLSGLEFEVLEPAELRDTLRAIAARLTRASDTP